MIRSYPRLHMCTRPTAPVTRQPPGSGLVNMRSRRAGLSGEGKLATVDVLEWQYIWDRSCRHHGWCYPPAFMSPMRHASPLVLLGSGNTVFSFDEHAQYIDIFAASVSVAALCPDLRREVVQFTSRTIELWDQCQRLVRRNGLSANESSPRQQSLVSASEKATESLSAAVSFSIIRAVFIRAPLVVLLRRQLTHFECMISFQLAQLP